LVILALATLGLIFLVREVGHQMTLIRSRNWPSVEGYVQKGEVLHSGATKFVQLPFRSLLGYRYSVNGESYWGIFVLPAEDMEVAERLQKQTEGKPLAVKYNPRNPSVSILASKELLGRRVIQDPMWLDPS
jgi:hypothetical protein